MISQPRVILITGASSGIGKATAIHLAQKGDIVYGTSRKQWASQAGVRALTMELNHTESIQSCINQIISQEGRIDILINAAGMGVGGPIELTSHQEKSAQIMTNFIGTTNIIETVLPIMRRQSGGKIIVLSSIGGIVGLPYQGYYSASKFALEGYCEALHHEVRRFGIHITLIEPGDFRTEFTDNRVWTKALNETSVYWKSCQRTATLLEKEERNGLPPTVLAQAIERILTKSHPQLRYVVATPIQKLSVYLKRILPGRLYHRLIDLYYQM